MRTIKSLVALFTVLVVMSTAAFAENRVVYKGTAAFTSFNQYDDGRLKIDRYGLSNLFIVDYAMEVWTLFGEPVYTCTAKWRAKSGNSVTLQSVSPEYAVRASKQQVESWLNPYDIRLAIDISTTGRSQMTNRNDHAPFVTKGRLICDPGVLTQSPNKTSFNMPTSPDWGELILSETARNHSQSKWGQAPKHWLSVGDAKALMKSIFERYPPKNGMPQVLSADASIYAMSINATDFHSEVYRRVKADKEQKQSTARQNKAAAVKAEESKANAELKRKQADNTEASTDSNIDDIFALVAKAEVQKSFNASKSSIDARFAKEEQAIASHYQGGRTKLARIGNGRRRSTHAGRVRSARR